MSYPSNIFNKDKYNLYIVQVLNDTHIHKKSRHPQQDDSSLKHFPIASTATRQPTTPYRMYKNLPAQ